MNLEMGEQSMILFYFMMANTTIQEGCKPAVVALTRNGLLGERGSVHWMDRKMDHSYLENHYI